MDLFDPSQVMEFYKRSKHLRLAIAIEQEQKDRIIDFAKKLEIDKQKDYEKERKKFHLTYKFS